MPIFRRKKKEKDTDVCKSCGEMRVHDNHIKDFAPDELFHLFDEPLPPTKGIFVQWVKHEEQGEVIALYCQTCKTTEFFCSPWASKNDTPFWQYWKITQPHHTHLLMEPINEVMVGTFKQSVMSSTDQLPQTITYGPSSYPNDSIFIEGQ